MERKVRAKKSALITGINGQDGSYLAELLLEKGYSVDGLIRRPSKRNTNYINQLCNKDSGERLTLHDGDLTDSANLFRIIAKLKPDELYNLATYKTTELAYSKAHALAIKTANNIRSYQY